MLCALISMALTPAVAEQDVPWWKQQKIIWGWGNWNLDVGDLSVTTARAKREVPREVFRNAAHAGITVFTERHGYRPAHARLAHEFGLKYFAERQCNVHWIKWGRSRIDEKGEQTPGDYPIKCPLDKAVYEHWLVRPFIEGVREGLIDGIHIDWESRDARRACYCDNCFSTFLKRQGGNAADPPNPPYQGGDGLSKGERFGWLESRGLTQAYRDLHSQRRVAMFTSFREKFQAIKPDLMFSSYNVQEHHLLSDFAKAMHTEEVPFVVLDASHYSNDDRQPWWLSYSVRLRDEGYLYIAGGWSNALFGAQPSQVSAARWIYEAALNEDGVWLWFEHQITDEMFRAYATAHRDLKAVERAVGDFLFHGERDHHFVTAVEWTGRPELDKAVIARTYHLHGEHLLHINNVDTDWPIQVRLRLPRLARERKWTIRDAIDDLYYTHADSIVWTSDDLQKGIVVTMEPRSDTFLRVLPSDDQLVIDQSQRVPSREIDAMRGHAETSARASEVDLMFPQVWSFRTDPDGIGEREKWYAPSVAKDGWSKMATTEFWKPDYVGDGWYAVDAVLPQSHGRKVLLHFGAIDENYTLWINGEYVSDNMDAGTSLWASPVDVDISGRFKEGQSNHIVVLVRNVLAAGGIWKSVRLLIDSGSGAEAMSAHERIVTSSVGRLVYTATEQVSEEGGSGVRTIISNTIRTIDADGKNQMRIRKLRGHLWSPTYRPDGRRIAFVQNAEGRGQIYVMNADGSGATNISSNAFSDRSPAWSPDGTRIAFVSERDGDWDIYVMNADGSGQKRLAGHPGLDRAPAWSPDGRRIAWESHTSGIPNIWICNTDGENSRSLINLNKPLRLQFSRRDGQGIFVIREGEGFKPSFPDNTSYLWDPVWSPDGKYIAVSSLLTPEGEGVAVLDADGVNLLRIVGIRGIGNVTWSPGGAQIAGTFRAPHETEHSGILLVNADGKEQHRRLVEVVPQGPRLGGAIRMGPHTWYSHGSAQPRRVLKSFYSLAFSPDGKKLAFSSDMDASGGFYVYLINFDDVGSPDGQIQRLDDTRSAWPQHIAWHP